MAAELLTKHDSSVESYLEHCLSLGRQFPEPASVKLILSSQPVKGGQGIGVLDVVVTTAKQCYTSGVALLKPQRDERSTAIAAGTLEAGHHTPRQHVHYTWRFEGISRSVTHDVFHAHPYYNSEQQSQRYVEAVEGSYVTPSRLTERQALLFKDAADYANQSYFRLLSAMGPEVDRRMHQMYPTSGWSVPKTAERLGGKARKIRREVARYVLPIAQKTTYYHTLSELQLLRLFRASQMENFSDEARYIIGAMVASIAAQDPTILQELQKPLPAFTLSKSAYIKEGKDKFDAFLNGSDSVMLPLSSEVRQNLAIAVCNVLGEPRLSTEEALARLLDPGINLLIADVYDVGMLDPLTSALRQASPTFLTKLSHTADSQRQRHRMTAGATPTIERSFDGSANYITPMIIRESEELRGLYDEMMQNVYGNVNRCLEAGMLADKALTLLPNAHALRVVESGDLFDWLHRWKLRLCYLSQEEIFFISVEQARQMLAVLPEAEKTFRSPCGIRKVAGVSPRCPEGDRFCGKPVFNMALEQYSGGRLI
ncbi:MAG: hypothetical protein A2782_00360 [Candidatus Blackburnbacteria bacterium RIFCSPHIGHO2_01_FULL_43_15b]|uniref:Thymidylate synthase ThyX n=1 Tax=Candidatus Blackburnbacteria bacterium RIFCSPHIGHO2_01_FULL_43_15b TaxID=1797513 RepID=A0A1G1UYJ4_9BACT|nr:MAG: hypothetical protein A2782_00360 [Candidatus Blackburnbacteria bacterium RIFCSPHIGHO2_01_FULL_43_15b]